MKSLAWWAHALLCGLNQGISNLQLPEDVIVEHASKQSVTLRRGDEQVTVRS